VSLRKNVIANYLGQGWVALMGLAFIPIYIKYLGIEAYGLIGIFALLQAWLSLLDVGMTPTLSREMARFTGGTHTAQSIRDLLRSIEIIAFGIAILISVGIWTASDWLASDWLKVEKLSTDTIAQAFTIMGLITALRFVENIYRSSIIGLQKQVTLNVINSVMATLRGLGAVGILILVSPSIEAFFLWQGCISILTIGLFIYIVYNALPTAKQHGKFSLSALQSIWRFAGGMLGITFLSLLLTQVDKILLSKLLTLEAFGYYSLASIVAGALYTLANPIAQAFFPRFSELIARNDQAELVYNYHKGSQLVTVFMGSAAIILIFFAEPILHLWTKNTVLAQHSALLLSLLALGNLLNGLMWIPYQVQLAYGWTSLAIKINIISVAVIIPAILWVTPRFGAEGAAGIWVALNAGYVLIGIHFMYHRVMIGEKWKWYFPDVFLPLGSGLVVAIILSITIPSNNHTLIQLAQLIITTVCILIIVGLTAQQTRTIIFDNLTKHKPKLWIKHI
jgi:O-antigen/teichoic acid export membrane protein